MDRRAVRPAVPERRSVADRRGKRRTWRRNGGSRARRAAGGGGAERSGAGGMPTGCAVHVPPRVVTAAVLLVRWSAERPEWKAGRSSSVCPGVLVSSCVACVWCRCARVLCWRCCYRWRRPLRCSASATPSTNPGDSGMCSRLWAFAFGGSRNQLQAGTPDDFKAFKGVEETLDVVRLIDGRRTETRDRCFGWLTLCVVSVLRSGSYYWCVARRKQQPRDQFLPSDRFLQPRTVHQG